MTAHTQQLSPLYGLMAEFETSEQLLHAVGHAHQAGYRKMDAYSPFPVHGLREALGRKHTKLPFVILVGGIAGFLTAYAMMYYATVVHWPLNIGGRPLHSWPNYIPILFEMTVLFSVLTAFVGVIVANGLPQHYHPVFNVPGFERASTDRFFLCIESDDPQFDPKETRRFLESLEPMEVSSVER